MAKSRRGYIVVFNMASKSFKVYKELDGAFIDQVCELKAGKTVFNIVDACSLIANAIDGVLEHLERNFLAECRDHERRLRGLQDNTLNTANVASSTCTRAADKLAH